MKTNKKIIMTMAVVLALATVVVGATFAWFTANDSVLNKMTTRMLTDGTVEIFENFPDDKLKAGATLDKEVGVTNTGDISVFVRMSFEEALTKLDAPLDGSATAYTGAAGYVPGLVNPAAYDAYEDFATLCPGVTGLPTDGTVVKGLYDAVNDNYQVVAWKVISASGNEFDGKAQKVNITFNPTTNAVTSVQYVQAALAAEATYNWTANTVSMPLRPVSDFAADNSIVAKTDDTNEFISLNFSTDLATSMAAGTWFYNVNDGWFYYMGTVDSGDTTPFLLSSISMKSSAASHDLYKYVDFDLNVDMQAIQALAESLTAGDGWALDTTDDAALIAALIDLI